MNDNKQDPEENSWAQLVSLTEFDSSPVKISKNKFVIGRNEDCDLSFEGNKLVSGKHCFLEKTHGKVWLCDTSTNGTVLNTKIKVSKGNRHELHHGDEIHVVYKKNSVEQNIGYLFQDKDELEKESQEELTQDYDYDADKTVSDDAVNQLDSSGGTDSPTAENRLKRKLLEVVVKADSIKKSKVDENSTDSKEAKSSDLGQSKASTSKGGEEEKEDDMLMTLSCIICQDILHDCISLQPCMHSFCSGCYSDWMEKSNECPSCRLKVDRINKNHLVNNMVEAYLKTKPDLKRSASDIKSLDEKNKITRDMLYPDRAVTGIGDSYSNSGSDDDENEDEDNGDDDYHHYDDDDDDDDEDGQNVPGVFAGFGTPFFGTAPIRPNTPVCRQCPNYTAPAGILPAPEGTPDDEDAKTFPTAPDYACRHNENHVLCLCCVQPMPDRRREYANGGAFPPQQCTLCYRSYCHAYWGCMIAHCLGCIGKFKDLNFGKKCLASLIMDNAYESNVLKDYLASKDMSVRDLLAECLAKMVLGEYRCINQEKLTNGINTPVCYGCGLQMFKQLAFQYRLEIPDADLPSEATSRPNCYWGKNCRTQRNKPEHAQKFNHVCEQTRTA